MLIFLAVTDESACTFRFGQMDMILDERYLFFYNDFSYKY